MNIVDNQLATSKKILALVLGIVLWFPLPNSHARQTTELTTQKREAYLAEARTAYAEAKKYAKEKKYDIAAPLAQKALIIRDAIYGKTSPATMRCVASLASIYRRSKQYAEAEPQYQRLFEYRQTKLGPTHEDTMLAHFNLAMMQKRLEKYQPAIKNLKQLLPNYKKAYGGEHAKVARALSELGGLYGDVDDKKNSAKFYRQCLAIREKTLGPDAPLTIRIANNLGVALSSLKEYDEAERVLRLALAGKRKTLKQGDKSIATGLANLGRVLLSQQKYEPATESFREAWTIQKEALGPLHEDTIDSLDRLGVTLLNQSKLAEAEPALLQALEARAKTLGENHEDTAESVHQLARLHRKRGEYGKCEALQRRALKIREALHGTHHYQYARSLNALAEILVIRGRYDLAEPMLRQTLAIKQKTRGPNNWSTALTMHNLASLYYRQGKFQQSVDMHERTLAIREKHFGKNHSHVARTLSSLAVAHRRLKNYDRALQLQKRALKIREKVLGADHPDTAESYTNLGVAHYYLNDFPAAKQAFDHSLAIREKALGPDHPDLTFVLNSLAISAAKNHDHESALPLFERTIGIARKSLNETHPRHVNYLTNYANSLASVGRTNEAADSFDRSQQILRTHVSRVLPTLTDAEQIQFLQTEHSLYFRSALSFGLAEATDPEMAKLSAGWLINGKAVAQESLAQRNLQAREPLAEQRKENSDDAWTTFDDVQRRLSDRAALIDIARIRTHRSDKAKRQWRSPHYIVWLTRGGKKPETTIIDLGSASEIDELVQRVRKEIHQAASGKLAKEGEAAAAAALQPQLKALAEKIWQPLTRHLKGVRQIVLSPDGELWLAPWSAVPIADDELLIERYDLRLVTSGRALVAAAPSHKTNAPVIVANPLFDQPANAKRDAINAIFKSMPELRAPDTRGLAAKNILPTVMPLPNTALEAVSIQPHMEKYSGRKPIVYQDRFALEQVAKALKSPKVASFATHGFFLAGSDPDVADVDSIAPDDTRFVASIRNSKSIENPLLRCGLLLAGCNQRDVIVGQDDGVLTGMEIVGIDFRGTDLVVLSACETGLGDVRNGEGVAGLRQAFQLAGAQSVVSSLWNVADEETARLMSLFFENLASGMSKSESLRQAQLARIKARRERHGAAHPFFWAAFTLTGQD